MIRKRRSTSDPTFQDEYTRVFDDIVITPKGVKIKPESIYKYQEPWDDEKFINTITLGGLNNLMPSQWVRRGYDAVNGNLTVDSWINGNPGIVPKQYSKEHPLMAAAANGLFDFWTLGGRSLFENAKYGFTKNNPKSYTTTLPYYPKYELSNDLVSVDVVDELKHANDPKLAMPTIKDEPRLYDEQDYADYLLGRYITPWRYDKYYDLVIDSYDVLDVLLSYGVTKMPRLFDFNELYGMPRDDVFKHLFLKNVNSDYNFTYYTVRPEYKPFVKRYKDFDDLYEAKVFNAKDAHRGFVGSVPKDLKDPVIWDQQDLSWVLGESKIPVKYDLKKPVLPKERVDWTNYRLEISDRLWQDWNTQGPLSHHLKRSGISNPEVLLDYMLSPELAYKASFSKPGFDINRALFINNVKDKTLKNLAFVEGFLNSLSKVLRRYGHGDVDIKQYLHFREHPSLHRLSLDIADELDISYTRGKKIVRSAMSDVLNRDPNAAKIFYTTIEDAYDNAFANRAKAIMFIPRHDKQFTRTVSHEFGHLEDGFDWKTFKNLPGVKESSLVFVSPSGESPLFKKAFDVDRVGMSKYFTDNGKDATEMAQRATLIADYLKLKPGEEITPDKLKYAIDNYVKDTGMDNNMTEFFNSIIDIKAAAKWMSIHHKSLLPIGVSASAAKSMIKPRKNNKNQTNNKK